MEESIFHILVGCGKGEEEALIRNALEREYDSPLRLEWSTSLKELRNRLKAGWSGMLLLSHSFSRKPLDDLLVELHESYGLPPTLLLLKDSRPGERSIAYRRGCYGWFTPDDLSEPGIIDYIVSIGKRARIDHEAFEENAVYKRILSSLGEGVGSLDKDNQLLFANDALDEILGTSQSGLEGMWEVLTRIVRTNHEARRRLWALMSGESSRFEFELIRDDGTLRHLEITATPRPTPEGAYGGSSFVVHDITSRALAEARLRESEERYRSLVRTIPRTAVLLFDTDLRFTLADGPLMDELGQKPEHYLGKTYDEALPPEFFPQLAPLYENTLDGKLTEVVQTLGSRTYALLSSPVRDDHGEIIGGMLMTQDVTEEQRAAAMMEAQIELGRKLEAATSVRDALMAALTSSLLVGGIERGVAYRRDSSRKGYRLVGHENLAKAPEFIPDDSRFAKMLGKSEPLWKVAREKLPAPLPELVRSVVACIPLGGGVEMPAFLLLCTDEEPRIPDNRRGALRAVSAMVSHALGRIDAMEELRRTSQYLRGVIDSQNDMMVRMDTEGRYTFVNEAYCKKFGLDPKKLVGSFFVPEVHPEDKVRTYRALLAVRQPPYRVSIEHRVKTVEGWRWLAWENSSILNEKGEVVEIQGVCRDITDSHNVQSALTASEAKLRAIFNNTLQAFVLFDTEKRILAFNRLAHWDRQTVAGKMMEEGVKITEYALPEELPRLVDAVDGVLRGETYRYESCYLFSEGEEWWYEIQIMPVYDEHGAIEGGLLTTIDINDRKKAVEALARNEQRFRSLVQNSTDIISVLNEKGSFQYQTASADRILGYPFDEIHDQPLLGFVHDEDRDEVESRFQELLHNPDLIIPIEFRFKHRKGHWVYLDAVGANRLNDPDIRGVVLTSRDITERRRSEEQLRLLATAIGNAEEAVLITDAQLEEPGPRIVFVNEGFTRISGYAPREVLGKTPRLLQGPKTDRAVLEQLGKEIAKGNFFSAETINYRKDGTEYNVEWRISPVFDAGGGITHFVSIQRDITDRKRAEQRLRDTAEELKHRNRELEQARRDAEKARVAVENAAEELKIAYDDAALARKVAEEANEAKSQFLASMSHEIRTPMTAILGFARLFRDRTQAGETREFADQVLTASEHLLGLINDILDLSRIEAGQVVIEAAPFSFEDLAKDIIELYRPFAKEKQLSISCHISPLPGHVVLDRSRVRQVLTNLVANAIKFTDAGEVRLEAECPSDAEAIVVRVRDTGRGIAKDQQQKIFEPFYQVHEGGERLHKGTGLGLSISKRLVEAMAGSIEVDSSEGAGTIFKVTLPCEFAREAGAVAESTGAEMAGVQHPAGPSLRVLVADDHEPNRLLIRHVLESRGHEVLFAEDGQQAVERFLETAVDLVIMDVQMPVMDGLAAIRKIRITPGGDRVPILTLTAYAMRGDRERSLAAGADDYISKPFDPVLLVEKVESLVRSGNDKSWQENINPELELLRLDYLRNLVTTAKQYLGAPPSLEELKIWGHRVAGSGGTFGFMTITEAARKLERALKQPGSHQSEIEDLLGAASTELKILEESNQS